MNCENFQIGHLLQHARENDVVQSDCRLERVPNHVREIVVMEPVPVGEAVGVKHNKCAEFLSTLPERLEFRIGKLLTVHVGENLDSLHTELTDTAGQLSGGLLAILQRDRTKCGQPIRPAGDELSKPVVYDARCLDRML